MNGPIPIITSAAPGNVPQHWRHKTLWRSRLRLRRSHFMQTVTVSIYICLTQVITFNKLSSTPNTVMRTFCQLYVCLCKNRQGRVSLCLVFAGWRSAGRLVIIIDINIKSLHLQKLPDSPTPRPWHCVNCSARSKIELTENWPGLAQHLRLHKTFSHFYSSLYTSSKMVRKGGTLPSWIHLQHFQLSSFPILKIAAFKIRLHQSELRIEQKRFLSDCTNWLIKSVSEKPHRQLQCCQTFNHLEHFLQNNPQVTEFNQRIKLKQE